MKAGLKRWVGRVPDLGAVIQRFPIPVVLMGIFTLIIIFRDVFDDDERLAYLCGGLILASYLLVSWTVGREGQGQSRWLIPQAIFAGLICLVAWFSKDLYFQIPMAIAGAILILGNAVRWRRGRDDLHVWDYTHKLWTGAIFATVGSIIFVSGTFAIVAALKSLFGIDINWLVEDLILPFGLGFLAPLYWMSTLPAVDEDYQELHDNPGFVSKAVGFMGTWLLAPLILIYAAILLAYGLKIVLAGNLPKGEIAQLTTPFLIIGTLTWLVLEPPFIKGKWLAKMFRRVWFWLSIPVSLLLGVAIMVRVREYGLTIERILILLCVFWALGTGLWFTFMNQSKRDIRYIPGLAGIMFLIASVTAPLMSVVNQDKRFAKFMVQSNILSDSDASIDKDAAKKAKGALEFLQRHKEYDRIKANLSAWDISAAPQNHNALMKALNLDEIKTNSRHHMNNVSYYSSNKSFNIAGYDRLLEATLNSTYSESVLAKYETGEILMKSGRIYMKQDGQFIFNFDINEYFLELPREGQSFVVDNSIPMVIHKDDEIEVAFLVKNINMWNDDNVNGRIMILTKGLTPKP